MTGADALTRSFRRLVGHTDDFIEQGGQALESLWKGCWSLAEFLLLVLASGARWMRHRPAAQRRQRALLRRRLRERDRLAEVEHDS